MIRERNYVMSAKIVTLLLIMLLSPATPNSEVVVPGWMFGEGTSIDTGYRYVHASVYNKDTRGLAGFSVQRMTEDEELFVAILLIPIREEPARVSPLRPLLLLDGKDFIESKKSILWTSTRGYTFIFPLKSQTTEKLKKGKVLSLDYMKYPKGEGIVKYNIHGIKGIIQVAAKFQEDEIKNGR